MQPTKIMVFCWLHYTFSPQYDKEQGPPSENFYIHLSKKVRKTCCYSRDLRIFAVKNNRREFIRGYKTNQL
jgi:hypothetical protein